MPSLFQETGFFPQPRRCYWDPLYVAPPPFCLSSKMTEKEIKIYSDFQEMLFNELLEIRNSESHAAAHCPLGSEGGEDEEISINRQSLRRSEIEKRLNLYFSSPASEALETAKKFGFCNTQTNASIAAKMVINRTDFLAR